MRLHAERARQTGALADLDPDTDWQEIYKRLVLWELAAEARLGFQLAFYRPFAVPRMAAVLEKTGHFRRDTTRRAYDTGLVMHEIIWGGADSERGRRMVRMMNALHHRPDVHQEDLTYILNALIVVPTRFMDRYGWRRVTAIERKATWRFYDELGRRMHIADRPTSYSDAEEKLRSYEARMLAASDAGTKLTAAVLTVLRDRIPAPGRPLATQITSVLVGDPAVSRALSLPVPSQLLGWLITAAAAVRRVVQRRSPPSQQPSFWPGRPAGSLYPRGYSLEQLGPKEQ